MEKIKINELKCQFNPKRFELWKSLHEGPEYEVLDIEYSPHVRFLRKYEIIGDEIFNHITKTPYYKMHKLYGKTHEWTMDKIRNFLALYKDIKNKGFTGVIEILKKPMHRNPFNDGHEIYEGHHRISCCYILGYENISAQFNEV